MKPYYEDRWVTIYHGDCREILPQLDVKVDLVLTDPPYGINLDLSWLDKLGNKLPSKSVDKIINDDGNFDISFLFQYSRWIVWGFPYISNATGTGWLVWDKQPGLNCDRLLSTPVEMAFTNVWRGFRLIKCMWGGFLRDNGEYRYEHPTQKPTKVMDYCIQKGLPESYVSNQYSARYLSSKFAEAKISNKEIAGLFPSKTGGLTGCVSNWLLGFNISTEAEYKIITNYLQNKCAFCEYEDLRKQKSPITILDPFLGSGTTCYCAKKLNRYSIGIEIEERYCEIAAKRCCQEVMELV